MRIRTFARSVCILGMGIVATALHAENIKGQISDKTTGEPLVGALVKVVGSTQGGVTDIDGHYQLRQLPAGTYTLEVTYVGYRTLQVPDVRLDGKDLSLDIQLDPDTQELEEVMVTARKNLEGEKALMMERQQASFAIGCRTADCPRTGRPLQHHHPQRTSHRLAQPGQQAYSTRHLPDCHGAEHHRQQGL